MLTLYEELYLLALDDEKGNLVPFARKALAYPLAGAILAELALLGKLDLGEKRRLVLADAAPAGDPLLDRAMEQIHSAEKHRKLVYWVSQLGEEPKKLRQSIGEQLGAKNVLVQDEKRFFRPEPGGANPDAAPSKFEMKNRLRTLILSNGASDLRSLALLKMLSAGDLLGLVFTQDEIEPAGRAIHKLVLTAAMGNTTLQIVEEIEQAICQVREDEGE